MSEGIIIALIGAIVSIGTAILAAMAVVKRVKSQNVNDDASAVALFEQAAISRQKENDLLRSQISDVNSEVQKLKKAISGPFRITLEFTTSPELKINRAEIELLAQKGSVEVAEIAPKSKR